MKLYLFRRNRSNQRIKNNEIEDTKQTHYWIVRVFERDWAENGRFNQVLSIPFSTKRQCTDFEKYLRNSKTKFKLTHHKIEQDGDYLI